MNLISSLLLTDESIHVSCMRLLEMLQTWYLKFRRYACYVGVSYEPSHKTPFMLLISVISVFKNNCADIYCPVDGFQLRSVLRRQTCSHDTAVQQSICEAPSLSNAEHVSINVFFSQSVVNRTERCEWTPKPSLRLRCLADLMWPQMTGLMASSQRYGGKHWEQRKVRNISHSMFLFYLDCDKS